jgi:Uma2 family endonuclease
MGSVAPTSKAFLPGTLGWTARDLDDPEVEELWFRGRYEIVEGVLTQMPAAYFAGGSALSNLTFLLKSHTRTHGPPGSFAVETDIVLSETRVVVADAVFMTPADAQRQADAVRREGRPDPARSRVYVPPTLIIESVSPDHGFHDRQTKRNWYAAFGVPNYWLLDAFEESLQCLTLQAAAYREDAAGRNRDEVRPSMFPGLVIPLTDVWEE